MRNQRIYIYAMRQRLGLEEGDTSRDNDIENMDPHQRLRLICGWYLGDPSWASTVIEWAKDAGFEVKP